MVCRLFPISLHLLYSIPTMSEQFHPSPTGSPELLPPRRLSVPLPDEIMRQRNIMQALAMQRMLNLDDSVRRDIAPEDGERMVAWGVAYSDLFRELFDDEQDTRFRQAVLAGDLDTVVALLDATRQRQSPSH